MGIYSFLEHIHRMTWRLNLIVDKEDIIIAIELFFTPIFLKIDDLDSSTRQFFEKLKMFIGKENYKTREFNQFELKCRFNKSKSVICKCIYNLRQQGYIKISSGTANIGYNYIIRTWDELENFKNKLKRTLIEQLASIS